MKFLMIASTLATLSVGTISPVQAASCATLAAPATADLSIDRRGGRCDTRQDIAEHPFCTRV